MINPQYAAFLTERGFQRVHKDAHYADLYWIKRLHPTNQDLSLHIDPPNKFKYNHDEQVVDIWNPAGITLRAGDIYSNRTKVTIKGFNKSIVLFDEAERAALVLDKICSTKEVEYKAKSKELLSLTLKVK